MIRDQSTSEQDLLPTHRGGSDAFFRLAFDHAPIAMAVIDVIQLMTPPARAAGVTLITGNNRPFLR